MPEVVDYTAPEFPLQIQEIQWLQRVFPRNASNSISFSAHASQRRLCSGKQCGNEAWIGLGSEAFLILNNDTLVTKNAIGALTRASKNCLRPGLCGGCYFLYF